MKIERVVGPLTINTHIVIEEADQIIARDGDMWFWKVIDEAAKRMGITPFCPCLERPHRISCPLGFENYFPALRQESASVVGVK